MDQQANAPRTNNGRNRTPPDIDPQDTGPQLAERLSPVRTGSLVLRQLADAQRTRPARTLSGVERHRLLYEWNETEAEFPHDVCVHRLFEEQAARLPDAIAVVFEGDQISYAELDRRANRLAHHLISLGVKPDARVAVCLERGFEMVVALLAALKAGGAYVPLDPAYPFERLRSMLEDSAPVALLTQSHLAGQFAQLNSPIPIVDMGAPLWQYLPDSTPDSSDLLSTHLAYVIYTSGSTGKPKGVMVEHRSLVNRLVWMQNAYGLNAEDAVLQKTPFSFDVSVWEFFWPLVTGATLVMARPEGHKDSAYLVEAISRNKITTLHFVPSMLRVFLDEADGDQIPSLIRVISSGEALPAALARRFHQRLPHAALHNLYGPTETTVDVTAWTCRPDAALTAIPIGRPIANTRVYILDAEAQPAPVGAEGELFIGGVGVARGYLNRPELTAERFLPDPFAAQAGARMYRSGDLCRWLPDGNIEYLGRNDFQVKLRGFRIELGEIEARLAQHPEVREAVVIAREDVPGDPRLAAYIVPSAGARPQDQDLRDFLGVALPEYMVPASFIPLQRMPLTVNGKLDRGALPAPAANNQLPRAASSRIAVAPVEDRKKNLHGDQNGARNGSVLTSVPASRESSYVPPSDPLEVQLIEIWEEVLGVKNIGVRDDFFALGGHSLLAARMFTRVAEKLHKKLPFATLFRGATIEKLAEVIRAEGWTSHWSVLVPIQEQGSKPPLFLLHGLQGNVLNFYGFRQHIPADQPLYGLQASGMDANRTSFVSIPGMAEHYIEEMRKVQPHGPYSLGGFSAGGLVAFEMARQLAEAGERTQFLALFDSYIEAAGGYWFKSFYSRRALRMSLLALRYTLHSVQKDGLAFVVRKKFRHMGTNLRIMHWQLRRKLFGGPHAGEHTVPRSLTPLEAFTRAIRVYAPPPKVYAGSAVSFRTSSSNFENPDFAEGWERYITGKVEHQQIFGGHEDIFREPHIAKLAAQLMEALQAAYRELEQHQLG